MSRDSRDQGENRTLVQRAAKPVGVAGEAVVAGGTATASSAAVARGEAVAVPPERVVASSIR